MTTRTCQKCKLGWDVENHHVIPKSIGGTDEDGILLLCEKHHKQIHMMLVKQVFKIVPKELRADCIKHLKSFTQWWLDTKFDENGR